MLTFPWLLVELTCTESAWQLVPCESILARLTTRITAVRRFALNGNPGQYIQQGSGVLEAAIR